MLDDVSNIRARVFEEDLRLLRRDVELDERRSVAAAAVDEERFFAGLVEPGKLRRQRVFVRDLEGRGEATLSIGRLHVAASVLLGLPRETHDEVIVDVEGREAVVLLHERLLPAREIDLVEIVIALVAIVETDD